MNMRYPHIASRLFNTPLLIHPQKLDAIIAGIGPRVFGITNEQLTHVNQDAIEVLSPELFSTKKGERNQERGYKVVDGVAVINVSGATVHRSRMEAPSTFLLGYDDITSSVEHAMENSDVHAVLRVYDSPGGEAQGAFEHAERMAGLIGKKPMVSVADGMAASAAYLAGRAADELVITNTGYAGSIGVVIRHVDVSRAMSIEGVQVTHIFAGAHKVDGHPFAPLPDSVRADYQEEVNGLYEMFVQAIAKHSTMSVDAIRKTEAAVYRGEKAVAIGLADRLSTTDTLISELAARRSTRMHSIASSQVKSEIATLSGMQQESTVSLNSTKGVTTMKLDELRNAHPELCAALVEEGRIAGFEAGASAELKRIKDVEANTMPGHEALISTLKFDGKTTGPEAAVQVLNAERALKDKVVSALASAAPQPVAFVAAPETSIETDKNLPIEDQAKAEWEKTPALRAEFGDNFNTYAAFRTAQAAGRVKIAGTKE